MNIVKNIMNVTIRGYVFTVKSAEDIRFLCLWYASTQTK